MDRKLIISNFYKKHMFGFQIADGSLDRIIDLDEDGVVGNIYCGYLSDVVSNIGAAFVTFQDKKGFLPLKEASKKLVCGDKVLVQVSHDAMKSKDYGLTTNIQLKKDAVVLTVGKVGINLSRKIKDKTIRKELLDFFSPYKNDEYGFILRTKCTSLTKEEILQEVETLISMWQDIKRRFKHSVAKQLLYSENKAQVIAEEFLSKADGMIVTDNEQIYNDFRAKKIDVTLYSNKNISISNTYKLGKYIADVKDRRVWLKSGAYLVIDYTEALTVIDVNTGKAEQKGDRESTFERINEEAAYEIARQLEIRNISGIVVIDFINMKEKPKYDELQNKIERVLKNQSVSCYVMGYTNLGLMELSRKKVDRPILEVLEEVDLLSKNELSNQCTNSEDDKYILEIMQAANLICSNKPKDTLTQIETLFHHVKNGTISMDKFFSFTRSLIRLTLFYYVNIPQSIRAEGNKLLHYEDEHIKDSFMDEVRRWFEKLSTLPYTNIEEQQTKKKMERAIEFIKNNYNTDLNMAVVSNYISMNYSLFSYTFKQYTEINFVNYLKDIRIGEAKKLLVETDLKINEIARLVGYEQEKQFTKIFKQCTGLTPTQYRNNLC